MINFEKAMDIIKFKNASMHQDVELCIAVLSVNNANCECKALECLKEMVITEAWRHTEGNAVII
ncbi:MAG: hypothetical protein E7321_01845 [Clostridiales bacterium]|nr:hypothetical protein [Clostridiales bacterium]